MSHGSRKELVIEHQLLRAQWLDSLRPQPRNAGITNCCWGSVSDDVRAPPPNCATMYLWCRCSIRPPSNKRASAKRSKAGQPSA